MIENFGGLKIAILFLFFILILKLILKGWQKVAFARTGKKFKFLLTKSPFSHDATWRDVRYSVLVIVDSIISLIPLSILMERGK
jgi:hypothetical protein